MEARQRGSVACGALGDFDRDRVARMAALCEGGQASVVHEDESSILALDRAPIVWEGARQRGLGWIGTDVWREAGVGDWRQAAQAGACGLVLDGRKRFLHSSVSGLAPIYWIEENGATYFSSRLDPLVRTCAAALSIDWDAWASIIALRYPCGARTPFAEVRRLGQFSTLRRRFGRGRASAHTWPWAEVEPRSDLAAAADACSESITAALANLPNEISCPLSGGRDSRMLFAILAGEGRVARAVTASDDEGEEIEEDLAAPVAALFGVAHERLSGAASNYAADWEERARRVEYQFVDHPWLMPVARRLEGDPAPLPDGFAIDIFVQSERHFNPPEALYSRDGRASSLALFDALRRYGQAHQALAGELHEPVLGRARDQFLAAVRPLEGHPSQNLLATYVTRSRRGVGCYAAGLFGTGGQVVAPGANHAVVCASLTATPQAKDDGRLYAAVFDRVAAAAGRLPSTTDTPRTGPRLPRRWRSPEAVEMHRRLLADGPLGPYLGAGLRGWLERPEGTELGGDLRLGMESISMLHSWCRRYRDVLRPVDPKDLLG